MSISGNQENILVSIIIPVYNVENYLHKCIDSVLLQTYRKLEIILVDDGSVDESGRICDDYKLKDKRIIVIHKANGGQSLARNAGLNIAKGEYIYFLDSDDWIERNLIGVLVAKSKEIFCDVILFDAIVVNEAGEQIKDFRYIRKREYSCMSGQEMYCEMRKNKDYFVPPYLLFISHEFLRKEGLLFFPGIIHEDELFTFQLLMKATKAIYIKERLYYRRIRGNSTMTSPISVRNIEGLYQVMLGINDYYNLISDVHLRETVFEHICSFFNRCLERFDLLNDQIDETHSLIASIFRFGTNIGLLDINRIKCLGNCEHLIWYGGGERCGIMRNQLSCIIPDEIWDINAENICPINGIPVKKPDFESLRSHPNWLLVVCIDNFMVWTSIKEKCAEFDFQNVCDWQSFYLYHKLKFEV